MSGRTISSGFVCFPVPECVAALIVLALAAPALAQDLPPDPGPARTARLFHHYCFSQLPDLESLASAAASAEFEELTGGDLEPYRPQVAPEELRGWRFTDFDGEYTLVTSRTRPDEAFKESHPDFAGSINYACSLVTPGRDAKKEVVKELTGLIGREPNDGWEETPLEVKAWGAKTDRMLVRVLHYAWTGRPNTRLLAASIFYKHDR